MLLELEQLSKSYFRKDGGLLRTVLDGLDLSLEPGESLAILGPSGSGKTTLLNLIAGLDFPDRGRIAFRGKNLPDLKPKELDLYRNQAIGIVFQLHHLLPQLSLLENVLLPTLGNPEKDRTLLSRAEMLLKRVGVWDQRNQRPGELSGGECQRAAVVRALINSPEMLLADEPTGALDEDNALNLTELLVEIHQEFQTALVMVTHSPATAKKMNRQALLSKGKLIESGAQ